MNEKNPFGDYFEDSENDSEEIKNSSNAQENSFSNKIDEEVETDSETAKKVKELKKSSTSGKKTAIISGISVIALVGTLFGLNATGIVKFDEMFNGSDKNTNKDKNSDKGINSGDSDGDSEEEINIRDFKNEDKYEWARKENAYTPVKTQKWETNKMVYGKTDSEVETNDKIDKAMFQKFSHLDYYSAAVDLPSEEAGFTSDFDKIKNEDGSLNPMYSYWTKESFIRETNQILTRLTNPIYGDWFEQQYTDGVGNPLDYDRMKEVFSNIISPSMLEPNNKSSSIPVYADWDRNNYGMGDQLLDVNVGFRWMGEVESTNTVFTYNDAKGQYEVSMQLNVKFSAWSKDRKPLVKNGVIHLNLGANNENIVPSSNKVIIESGSLTIL